MTVGRSPPAKGKRAACGTALFPFVRKRLRIELDRLKPQWVRDLGIVGLDLVEEPLGVLAADEELDSR